jgi:uncharacterized protein DUF4349
MTGPETAELEAVDAALAGHPVAPEHAELAELALLLRDERPEPTPSWAAHLDRRVTAGFPARPKEKPRRRLWLSPATLGPAAAICLVVALVAGAALSGGGSDQEGGGSAGSAEPLSAPASGGAPEMDQAERASEPPSTGSPGSDARRDRDVQRSATITLAAPPREIDKVASDAGRVAADLGGFVDTSNIRSGDGGTLQLRVPSGRLDTAIERLSDLARVRELSRQSRDITSVVVSARERLNDARAERESLLRQLAAATTVNETESIRARLRIVSRQIASARARLRSVNNQARFADLGVTLEATRNSTDEGAWTPGDAFDDALRVLEVTAGVLLIAFVVALPLLIAGGLGWAGSRGLRRRRRERALDMA